jgi:hypothetical protein
MFSLDGRRALDCGCPATWLKISFWRITRLLAETDTLVKPDMVAVLQRTHVSKDLHGFLLPTPRARWRKQRSGNKAFTTYDLHPPHLQVDGFGHHLRAKYGRQKPRSR